MGSPAYGMIHVMLINQNVISKKRRQQAAAR